MQAQTMTIAYFGKVPSHGDFVRRNATGTAVRAMDAWLQKGLYLARQRLGRRFEVVYDAAGPVPFCFDAGDRLGMLIGVMHPSSDRVGRRFPFIVGLEASNEIGGPQRSAEVPVHYASFLEGAAAIVQGAARGSVHAGELVSRTEGLGSTINGGDARSVLERFYRETPLPAWWERLWGHSDDSRKYILFKNLLDIVLPLRQGVPPSFPLVLRFPLSADENALSFDVSFWTEVCLRLVDVEDVRPSLFWTYRRAEDGTGPAHRPYLLMLLRPPGAAVLSYLVAPDLEGETLCDLENLGEQSAAQAALSIPAKYGALLEADHLSLWDFLQQL